MFGWLKRKQQPTTEASRILPRIKNDQFERALRDNGVPDDQMPVIEPLVGNLFVTYAFDLDDSFMTVMAYHLQELGLRSEDLRETAMTNLRARTSGAKIVPQGDLRRVVLGENLDACALLSPKLWTSAAQDHPGGVVAVAPNRDLLLYCDASSKEGRAAMAMNAAVGFATGGTHALSLQFMRWTDAGWVLDEESVAR